MQRGGVASCVAAAGGGILVNNILYGVVDACLLHLFHTRVRFQSSFTIPTPYFSIEIPSKTLIIIYQKRSLKQSKLISMEFRSF